MFHRLIHVCVLIAVMVAVSSTTTRADVIPGITASADHGPSVGFNLANLVNGSGLVGGVPTLDAQHNWPAQNNSWQSYPIVTITFNLHDEYFVDTMCVWPWSSNTSVSAKDVEVSYSPDGINYTPVFGISQIPNLGNWANQWQVRYDFDAVTATHMRMKILSNWGYRTPSGFAYTGLNEVQFGGALVPEPSTLGLAVLGALAMLRQRRG